MARAVNETTSNQTISAYGPARSTITGEPLSPDEFEKIDVYWRASLYLSMGMLYLEENPLLREPLKTEPRTASRTARTWHPTTRSG